MRERECTPQVCQVDRSHATVASHEMPAPASSPYDRHVSTIKPAVLATIDVGAAYRDLRERVTAFLAGLSEAQWGQVVPHCPEWTVRQTVAHLAGVIDDAVNQNMEGVATPAWTQTQVNKRSVHTGPAIVEEWNTFAPFVEAVATQRGMALSQLLFDAATHEHDLRHALSVPGARNSTAIAVAVGFVTRRLADRPGGSPIHIVIDGERWSGDDAETVPTLTASAFDVVRSVGSRRARQQVEALQWSTRDPVTLDALPFFGYPPVAISE